MSNASELATLVCPPGTADAPISHGTIAYLPYRADQHDPASPWLVDVPPHVAAPLLRVGGFRKIERK
jgi:hypothetical protein